MATIDLRDKPLPRRFGDFQAARTLLQPYPADPAIRVLQRVVLADIVAAVVALIAAAGLLYYEFHGWALVPVVLWPLALAQARGYDRKRLLTHNVTSSPVVAAAARVFLACAVVGLFVPALDVRQSLRLTLLLAGATIAARRVVALWLNHRRRSKDLLIPVLARGRAMDLNAFLRMLDKEPCPTVEVVAVQCTDRAPLSDVQVATRVPLMTDPVDAAVRNGVSSMIIVGPTDLPSDVLRRTIWRCQQEGIDTLMLPIVEPVAPPRVAPVNRGGLSSMVFQGPNRRMFGLKRLMDRVLAAIALVLLAPMLLGIGFLVRRNSPGPALFRQTRVGRDGRPFTMVKFRTMGVDAEQRRAELEDQNTHAGGTLFKLRQDPRITSVGRVLRKFSLDELPQLINVVRGEMSLVGPRPPLPDEVANYPADFMRRFAVNPGLTGLWQVSGRSNLDPLDSARLDTQYVEHWSLGLDLRILVRTAKVVLTGEGAY
jgi:exopolysaccharide biosynthesis polyprenyl glycosylphosphotransferase